MSSPPQTPSEDLVALRITADERRELLHLADAIDPTVRQAIEDAPAGLPLMLQDSELADLADVLEEALNLPGLPKKRQGLLEALLDRLDTLLNEQLARSGEPGLPTDIAEEFLKMSPEERRVKIANGFALATLAEAYSNEVEDMAFDISCLNKNERKALQKVPRLGDSLCSRLNERQAAMSLPDMMVVIFRINLAYDQSDEKTQAVYSQIVEKLIGLMESFGSAHFDLSPDPLAAGEEGSPAKVGNGLVYRLKITLREMQPEIWRRIAVPDCTLEDLHYRIQDAMGWDGDHLYAFEVAGNTYSHSSACEQMECGDAAQVLLSELHPATGKAPKISYEYDFGDSWRHDVVIEKVGPPDPKLEYPVCLDGENACPPEDVGGAYGYMEFLSAQAEGDSDGHPFMDFLSDFDPSAFDCANATQRMRSQGRPADDDDDDFYEDDEDDADDE